MAARLARPSTKTWLEGKSRSWTTEELCGGRSVNAVSEPGPTWSRGLLRGTVTAAEIGHLKLSIMHTPPQAYVSGSSLPAAVCSTSKSAEVDLAFKSGIGPSQGFWLLCPTMRPAPSDSISTVFDWEHCDIYYTVHVAARSAGRLFRLQQQLRQMYYVTRQAV